MHNDPRETLLNSPMSRMQIGVVIITIALNALDGFDVLSISLAAAPIRDEFGIGPAITGLLLSMELVGMAIGSIVLGRYADRWGRRPLMLLCLVLMTVGMFMVTTPPGIMAQGMKSISNSMGLLLDWPIELMHISIWRIVTGLGIGGMLAATNAVVAEFSSRKHKHLNVSLMTIGYPVGASIGGFIAAWLLQDYTWRSVFYLGFAMTLAMLPIVYFFVPETIAWSVRHQKPGALERINATLKRMGRATVDALPDVSGEIAQQAKGSIFAPRLLRTTLLLTVAYFFHITTFYFLLKWTGVIVADRGFDASQAGNVLSWITVGGACGGAIFGFLTLRYDLKRLTIGTMLLSTVFVGLYGSLGANLTQTTLICIAAGFFANAGITGLYAIFAHAFPTQVRAAGTGFAIGIGRGGSVLAPIAAGLMFAGGVGVPVVSVIMGACSLAAAIVLLFLKLNSAPPEAVEVEQAIDPSVDARLSESAA